MAEKTRQKPRRRGRPTNPISRAELLRIARDEFAQTGYGATSMSQIANAAKLTKASLFHHFATKADLYLEMMEVILEDLRELVLTALQRTGPFRERLDYLSETAVVYLGEHPQVAGLLSHELIAGGPFMDGGGADAVEFTLQAVGNFVRSGMEEGVIPDQDEKQLALSIVGVHLYYYACVRPVERYLETKIDDKNAIKARVEALSRHIRNLCGLREE